MSKNPLKRATMLFVNSSLRKIGKFINLYFEGLKYREQKAMNKLESINNNL